MTESNLDPMTDDEARRFVELRTLEALLARLEPAKCWRDETSCGYRNTRWWHLSPADFDQAKEIIRRRILELKASKQKKVST